MKMITSTERFKEGVGAWLVAVTYTCRRMGKETVISVTRVEKLSVLPPYTTVRI